MSERRGHPAAIREDVRKVVRLEYWNVAWSISYVAVVGLAMGSSQAMRTAWIEDLLGLIPPIAFLIAIRFEARGANARFNYGYDRVNGLGFVVAAVALLAVGLFLVKDAVVALVTAEHVTIGSVRLLGHDIWLGWFMLAAQAYATIPPLIIGRMELPLAERLRDKLIHTDALMNKANWQTGVAGFLGVALLGWGWWWADSVAAIIIAIGIVADGCRALRIATAELLDGTPRELDRDVMSSEARAVAKTLKAQFPGTRVLMRETGRYLRAEVVGAKNFEKFDLASFDVPDFDCEWRLDSVAFRAK